MEADEDVLSSLAILFRDTTLRTRQDVASRRSGNKGTEFSVVKTTWNSFCKPDALILPIDATLRELNKTIFEAYILANFHIVRICSAGDMLPHLDQKFFYNCLSAVSVTQRRKPETADIRLRESVRLYVASRPEGYRPPDGSNLAVGWYQNASLQMSTNCKNDVAANFYRRLRKYLKHKHNLDGTQAYHALKDIHSKDYRGEDPIVLHYRAKLPTSFWITSLEDAPEMVMPLQHEILRHCENHQSENPEEQDKRTRIFTLLPTKRGFGCGHWKMCTNGLQGLLKRAGMPVPTAQSAWRQVADEHWRRLFKIEKFETVNRRFAGEIVTDGKAVSIVMKKPKRETVVNQIDIGAYNVVWGLDPGRTDTFVATNEEGEKKRCSSKEYYNDAGFKSSGRTMRYWHDQNAAVKEAITNMPTKKTSNLETLKVYIAFALSRTDLLLDFYMRKSFRKLKLRRFIMAEKKLRRMCLDLAPVDKRTLVGFGDWSATDSAGLIKSSPAGPVKRFEKRLKRYCKVVSVDEFRSSKLHHDCHRLLTNSVNTKKNKRDGKWRKSKVHSVLHCRNSGCNGMTVNRDSNASRNILMLLKLSAQSSDRPLAFSRGTA